MNFDELKEVLVVGAGIMGHSIAQIIIFIFNSNSIIIK